MSKIKCLNCPTLSKCAFSKLNEDELHLLDEIKQTKSYVRGDFLNQKGHTADGLYCLKDGFAKITWPDQNFNKESIVKIAASGDFTGYRCLFSEETFRATAIVLDDLHACFIPKDFFIYLLKNNSEFNFEILKRMGMEIKRSEVRLHSFCAKNVRERLAECLITLKELCGKEVEENHYVLEIRLSRDELSSLIGTAKETVVRTLSDFKEEKVIGQNDQHLMIIDLDGLKKIANNNRSEEPVL